MSFIKRNIWLAFYAIIFSGSLILAVAIYITYTKTYEEFRVHQESITLMSANSLKALFQQHEVALDILIKQLTLHQKYTSKSLSYEIVSNAINQDYAMQSFAVIAPDGKMFANSWSLEDANNFSLLELPEAKDDFIKTLQSHKSVIGRTYYNSFLNRLIIPIRKTAFDHDGKPLFVVVAALDMETAFPFFVNNSHLSQFHDTYLFREHDRYFQIAPKAFYSDQKIYYHQIPLIRVEEGLKKVTEAYKTPIEKIKNDEIVTSIIDNHPKKESFMSSIFLKEYDMWLTTEIKKEILYAQLYQKTALLFTTFIIIIAVFYWLFKNIATAEKEKKKALEFQANHDYLTHLKNRFFLDNYFKQLDDSSPFSLFFIDTDNFKTINDNYGHEYGDIVLKEISRRLLALKSKNDILVRYSGDEFLLICYDTSKTHLYDLCKIILFEINQEYIIQESRFFLTASIGIAQFPQDGKSFDEIKRYADLALYEAKKEKNCFVLFEDSIKEFYHHQAKIEHELKGALNRHEFYMTYQPQMTNEDKIYGVEALLRWENKALGLVPPDKFISLAESIGLMPSIGHFVMEQSMSEIKKLQAILLQELNLSINVSVKQFIQSDFVENIVSLLEKYDYNKVHLVLEVTENVFIQDVEGIISKFVSLKDNGLEISLDDFGTGYSSLSLLKKLPIGELKIDKSFVNDIIENPDSSSMVEGIIAIGKKLNMRILAEGIEKKEQKELLKKLGCDLYQGYFYAKPMRIEKLEEFCLEQVKL